MAINLSKVHDTASTVAAVDANPLKIAQASATVKSAEKQLTSADNKVATVADLPNAADNKGRLMLVLATNRWMFSNGVIWQGLPSSDIRPDLTNPQSPEEVYFWGDYSNLTPTLYSEYYPNSNQKWVSVVPVFRGAILASADRRVHSTFSTASLSYITTDWTTKAVAAGDLTHMAIKQDGTLWTWGLASDGILGDGGPLLDINGNTRQETSPVQVAGGGTWTTLTSNTEGASDEHTGAIKADGTLWMWGANTTKQGGYDGIPITFVNGGRLGDGTTISRSSPVQVAGGGTWQSVTTAYQRTGAIKTDGTLWMWGNGSLGDGTTNSRSSPVQVAGGGTWQKVELYWNSATAGIKTDGTLWTWGGNSAGQLGNGNRVDQSSPVQVAGGGTWTSVTNEVGGVAAIKTDGTLWVWGSGSGGGLGDGTTNSRSSPVQVAGGGTWLAARSAAYGTFAGIKTDGTLWVWGNGSWGGLGDGTTNSRSSPVQVAGGGAWTQVGRGDQGSIYAKRAGTFGFNEWN